MQFWTRTEQSVNQTRRSVDQMLAVVQDNQEPATREIAFERVRKCAARLLGDSKRRRDRLRNQIGTSHRGQLDQPDTVREVLQELACGLQGETSLTDPAWSRQRQEPLGQVRLLDGLHFLLAAPETGQLSGKVMRRFRSPLASIFLV